MTYLDNAATSFPKPDCVKHAAVKAFDTCGNAGRSGHGLSAAASGALYSARCALSDLYRLDAPERVVLTYNTTHAANLMIKCFMPEDSHVLISSFEHNSIIRPLEAMKHRGIRYSYYDVDLEDDDATLDNISHAIDRDTSAVIMTHASNTCGRILPVERASILAKKAGLLFCVDDAQSAGSVGLNMGKSGVDLLCVPSHKGLLGIQGSGALLVGRDVDVSYTSTLIEGGTGSDTFNPDMPSELPERFEAGTMNVPAAAAFTAGIEYVKRRGIEEIHELESVLRARTVDMLSNMRGVELYGVSGPCVGIVLFNIKGRDCSEVSERLSTAGVMVRGGYHCAPQAHRKLGTDKSGAVRISFGGFNKPSDLDKLYSALKDIL